MTGEAIQKLNATDASNAMLMIPGLRLRGGYLTLGALTSFGASAKDEPLLIVDGVMMAGGVGPQTVPEEEGVITFQNSPVMEAIARISPDIIDFVEVLRGPEASYYG